MNCMKNIQFVVMQTFCIMPFLQGLSRDPAAYLPFAVPWETPKLVLKEPYCPNTLFQDLQRGRYLTFWVPMAVAKGFEKSRIHFGTSLKTCLESSKKCSTYDDIVNIKMKQRTCMCVRLSRQSVAPTLIS